MNDYIGLIEATHADAVTTDDLTDVLGCARYADALTAITRRFEGRVAAMTRGVQAIADEARAFTEATRWLRDGRAQ